MFTRGTLHPKHQIDKPRTPALPFYSMSRIAGNNTRHQSFVSHYLGDCLHNGTLAAIRAGFSEKGASTTAARLLRNVRVIELIERFRARQEKKIEISRERILNELGKMGFSNMQDYLTLDEEGRPRVDFTRLSRDQAAAIQEITVEEVTDKAGSRVTRTKFKLANKKESLELLGRHHKLFEDGGQLNVGVKVIMVDIPRPDRSPDPPELPENTP